MPENNRQNMAVFGNSPKEMLTKAFGDSTMSQHIIRKDSSFHLSEKEKNGIRYLTFPVFDRMDFISHSFSTRIGGASKGVYGEANFSYTRGDDPGAVDENYRRMAAVLGFGRTLDHFVQTFQTHTANIRCVTAEDAGKGTVRKRDYTDVDGLITDVPGLILTTFHADCPPVYIVDPVKKAIGLVHSGWKGTVHRISAAAVRAMTDNYGSDPENLVCAIGPSICADCYEVSSDVADAFVSEFHVMPEMLKEGELRDRHLPEHILYAKTNGRYQLSLWTAITQTLKQAGVRTDNIYVTDICTRCNPKYLFSHRYSGDKRGNLAAFLAIKKN
jgi:YfiH family protein